MRLTEDQVAAAIKRPGKDVRYAAVNYFSVAYSRNTAVMPAVIEMLEQWGADALLYNYPIADLAQTPETIAWVVEQLSDPMLDPDLREHYSRLIRSADLRLLAPHEDTFAKSRTIWPELRYDCHERLKLLQLDSESLWRELWSICREGDATLLTGDVDYRGGERIVEVLALDPANADRMLPLLAEKIASTDDEAKLWMECFVTSLAGELRYEPAAPLLIEKLRTRGEVLGEESARGLIKIGGDPMVAALREQAREAHDAIFRLSCSEVLRGIHSDASLAAGFELLAMSESPTHSAEIAQDMVCHLSTEANEAAREFLAVNADFYPLQEALVASCALLEQDFAELPAWRSEVAARHQDREGRAKLLSVSRAPAQRLDPPEPPLQAPKHVGRNEPCPCGSGKKFKKCCLANAKVGN